MKEKNSLPTKYRPKTWAEVIGKKNQITCEQLRSVLSDRKVHLFLLTGPSGCGKTTIARLIKDDLKCSKLDFIEINGGNDRGIETMRKLIMDQQRYPLEGDVKVILIDECHRLTRDSWEALLKEAEEPSTGTYFIFATTNPEKILDTMINRCGGPSGAYKVYSIDRNEMAEFLKGINEKEDAGVPINVINEIVTQASGSPRQALVLFEKVMKLKVEKMLDAITHPIGKEPRMKGLTLQDFKQFGELTYLIDEILPENCLIILAGREGAGKSLVAFTIIKALLMDLFPDPERSDHGKDIGRQIAEVRIESTGESSHDAHTISTNPKPTNNEPANPEPIDDRSLYNEPPDEDFSIRLFGKYEVVKGGPVLLIDQETPGVLLQDRVDKMWAKIKRTGKYVGEKNSFECLHFHGIKVDNETSLKQLKEKIQEFKPVLLVIDSLSTIHKGSEVSPQNMALIMEKLRELVNEGREWGMTVLVIHHHSRAGAIRGTTAIPAGCDIEYSLKADKDGHSILKSEKTRVKNFAPIRLKLDTSYGRLRILYDGAVSDMFEELKKILQDNGWVDYKTISDKLSSIFPSLKDGKLRYTLKKYAGEGKIIEDSVPNPKGGKPILKYKLK